MYQWNFLATDIDTNSLEHAKRNIEMNDGFSDKITLCTVPPPEGAQRTLLQGVIPEEGTFDFCMSNPPFFDSLEDTQKNPKRVGISQEISESRYSFGRISRNVKPLPVNW